MARNMTVLPVFIVRNKQLGGQVVHGRSRAFHERDAVEVKGQQLGKKVKHPDHARVLQLVGFWIYGEERSEKFSAF
jgi:hypothetical protein